ncbi:hypothetical protein [Streptomyces sp. KLOTTS4A1]|uniref:hypothetical protein n=1 Tax=Streptomyces sp. KLOTTS4A1 TaxID=3390996 RepID=UPI0039F50C11
MPRRPDAEELEKLTEEDRRDVGLPADGPADAAAQYEEAQTAVDRQADSGELPTGTESRKHREDFPPTDYED